MGFIKFNKYSRNFFFECSNLELLPNISTWNTKNIINMQKLFAGCSSLKSLPDI